MALGANIRYEREKRDWTLEQLEERSGVGRGTISALENRDSSRSNFAAALAEAFGVDLEQLLTERTHPASPGVAHPKHSDEATVSLTKHRENTMRALPPEPGYVRLPILAEAAAGAGRAPETDVELIEHVDVSESWVRQTLRANPANLKVLTARGHSMAGVVEDGDALFVAPCTEFADDGLYIIAVGGLLRVKRLRLRVLDKLLSIESNDGSAPELVPLGEADDAIRVCGRVVAAWSLKKL